MANAHARKTVPPDGMTPTACDPYAADYVMGNAATFGEMALLLTDADAVMNLAGGLIVADALGIVVAVKWPFMLHVSWWSLGMLAGAMLSWISAAVHLVWAERPVTNTLSELRYRTGAPIDPSVPWEPRSSIRNAVTGLSWKQLLALIAAANVRRARARSALAWSAIAVGSLCAWALTQFMAAALG